MRATKDELPRRLWSLFVQTSRKAAALRDGLIGEGDEAVVEATGERAFFSSDDGSRST